MSLARNSNSNSCEPDPLSFSGSEVQVVVALAFNARIESRVHEINGTIPAAWDNLEGFDTDPRNGRITAEGYVTRFGDLNLSCAATGPDCHPIKMVQAFAGYYGSFLLTTKEAQIDPSGLPERDIYFCIEQVCAETDLDAVSSGWIGQNN